jgi:hypothetical protein
MTLTKEAITKSVFDRLGLCKAASALSQSLIPLMKLSLQVD